MNRKYNYVDSAEYPAAIAAAVYAITIQDFSIDATEKENAVRRTSTESKSEDTSTKVLALELKKVEGEVPHERIPISTIATHVNMQERVAAPVTSFRKSPLIADKQFDAIAAVESENAEPKGTGASTLWIKKNQTFADKNVYTTGKLDSKYSKPAYLTNQTDVWESTELAKIIERYEVLNATILQWENKEKTAAKRKLEKKQSELEKKRAKAMQHYRTKVAIIDQIAGGARTKAEQNRQHEEVQIKEKAHKIRTGKYPASCFCCYF